MKIKILKIMFLILYPTLFLGCYKKEKIFFMHNNKNVLCEYRIKRFTGEKDGPFIRFSMSGDTLEKSYFKNGKLEGKSISFFENGLIQIESEFFQDMINGEFIEYYNNGQIRCKLKYKNNKLIEIIEVFDSSGNKLSPGLFNDGNGLVNIYYPNGAIYKQGHFKNGLKSGYWKFYNEKGDLLDSTLYEEGYSDFTFMQDIKY
mgnify:CR=1 FL=1